METDEVKMHNALEQEYAGLKKLLAERDLQIDVMKKIKRKDW